MKWQTQNWSSYRKFQLFAWMITNSRSKNLNQFENYQRYGHTLSWNACTWHDVIDQTFYGLSTNLHEQSQNGLRLATDVSQDWFHTFITQINTDNIVMWATRLSIVDWFFPRHRLCWRPWGFETNFGRNLTYLWKQNTCLHQLDKKQPSVSHCSTESEIISLDAGLRMDGLPALDLWDVVIEVLRSTSNTERPIGLAPGNWCGTGNHSSNKTKTKTPTERSNRDVDQFSNVDYVPTNTHSSQGESQLYIFEHNEAVIKMIIKGRSPTMTRVQNPQSCSWVVVRKNQFRTKNPNQICWRQKTTRWHANQIELHTWWVESSSSFVQHYEFFDFSREAISVIFFVIRSGSRGPCQREDKKRLPVKVHRWQNQSLWIDGEVETRESGVAQPVECEEEPSARFERSHQSGECRRRTWQCSWHQETDAQPKPRSNRVFSSEATGKYSKWRPLETGRQGWIT